MTFDIFLSALGFKQTQNQSIQERGDQWLWALCPPGWRKWDDVRGS